MTRVTTPIAFIGAGQMAEALIGGLLAAQVTEPSALVAADPSGERRDLLKRRFGIRVGADNRDAAGSAQVVVLAVKPQVMETVLSHLAPVVAGRLVLSIAAGVSLDRLAAGLPGDTRLVRAMPNAPALVREGMTALAFAPGVRPEERDLARTLFEAVGRTIVVDEALMDAVTGLSGSGPAFVFVVIEALADGGVKMGLPRPVAETLAAQTVLGAARMLLDTKEHPGRLKDRVASPGGTTIAGLYELERAGFRNSLMAAVEAATIRSRELRG
ncbi:MAG: pyrroline-5-carboxylate reductase [Nitrospirales bacterium]